MKALIIQQFGGPERLQIADWSMPVAKRNELLIRVHAAGINPVDYKIRNGSMKWVTGRKLPRILGFDVAGTVEQAAPDSEYKPGDKVFGMLPFTGGGYAEFVAISEKSACSIPPQLSMEEAAATPLAALTAYQALLKTDTLQAGKKVLINGASGGVGSFAVQIARAMQLEVTAVTSSKNAEMVKRLGAHRVIDYTNEDFTQSGWQFDTVFDAVAKSSFSKCKGILEKNGQYITTIPNHGLFWHMPFNILRKKKASYILVKSSGKDLGVIAEMMENNQVKAMVEKVFPLNEGAIAHQLIESERVRGKLVLTNSV